jgi:hypothetical protein
METKTASEVTWWGKFRIPADGFGLWRIGPLSLCIQRSTGEWRLKHESGNDYLDDSLEVELPGRLEDGLECEDTIRYLHAGDSVEVRLTPALADRPVVTRSDRPMYLLPGEEVAVYTSSPLWVRIEVGKPAKKLCEIPVFRPSDTWFGPNTLEGELCYASRSHHCLRLEQPHISPHRAITSVLVRNRSGSMLSLERMQVPVMNLALYQAEDGRLWTDDVVFERTRADDFASLRTRARDSRGTWTTKATRLAVPRQEPADNIVVRAFATLFG